MYCKVFPFREDNSFGEYFVLEMMTGLKPTEFISVDELLQAHELIHNHYVRMGCSCAHSFPLIKEFPDYVKNFPEKYNTYFRTNAVYKTDDEVVVELEGDAYSILKDTDESALLCINVYAPRTTALESSNKISKHVMNLMRILEDVPKKK